MVMELCDSNLSMKLKQNKSKGMGFSEPEITNFIAQIIPAMSRLHNLGFAHMDIKPGNSLII